MLNALVLVTYFVVDVYITIEWILQANLRYLIINFNLIKIVIISRWIKWHNRIIQIKWTHNRIPLNKRIIKLSARIIPKKLKLIHINNLEIDLFELLSQIEVEILEHELLHVLDQGCLVKGQLSLVKRVIPALNLLGNIYRLLIQIT